LVSAVFVSVSERIHACENEPPTAVLTADAKYVVKNTTTINFDGSGSYDNWRIIKYEWDFHYDGSFNCEYYESTTHDGDGFDGKTTYLYASSGTYDVALKVFDDDDDYDIAEFTVYVSDQMEYKYVKTGGTSDGSSWSDPNGDIQAMVDSFASNQCGQVWVAEGTYAPGSSRSDSFVMREGVDIYGGFAGDESTLAERDWAAHPARLSGEIGSAGNDDNCYHVAEANDWSALDGLYIQDGNADGSGGTGTNMGAGIYSYTVSPTIRNCVIKDNHAAFLGGGILVSYAAPTITNCLFRDNTCDSLGGAIFVGYFSCPVITNCVIVGNTAHGGAGINVHNYSDPVIVNCTITGNEVTWIGAGIKVDDSEPTITNCILWGNSRNETQDEIAQIYIYGNRPLVKYSCIQDDDPGEGSIPFGGGDPNYNIDDRPWFVDSNTPEGPDGAFVTVDDGLQLRTYSPCIDKGINSAIDDTGISKDILGKPRKTDGDRDATDVKTVDMGAYETTPVWYVDGDASTSGDGKGWSTALKYLQDALLVHADSGDEIWVADGTYYPDEDEGSNVTDNDRTETFEMVTGVDLYGGFNGTETARYQRNWTANDTILCGDIDKDGHDDGDSYHVVTGADDANLDGFTITFGNANGSGNDQYGGGVLNIQASPNISNCIIKGNYADYGGGIFNYGIITDWSLTDVTNCLFFENEAIDGGAVYNNNYSWDLIMNCTFSKNDASNLGGAIYDYYSWETDIVNSILWGNTDSAAENWQVISDGSWIVISYTDVNNMATDNGGTINPGSGNLSLDPLFADAGSDDFHLKSAVGRWNGSSWVTTDTTTSWCVDAGNPGSSYSNEPSPNGSRINMGAYGNTTEASKSDAKMVIYVDCDNTSSPWLGTASDPYQTIDDGIDDVRSGGIVSVEDGTYYERLSFNSSHKGFSLIGVDTPVIDGEREDTVITFDETANTIVINGFAIVGGYSLRGGGMHIDNSSPTITNCIFASNEAGVTPLDYYVQGAHGGGLCIDGGSPTISYCIFYNNFVDGVDHDPEHWPVSTFNYFKLNRGGAIYTNGSSATISYCVIGDDVAENWAYGNDYYSWASHEVYTNGSTVPTYSNNCIFGGFNGERMHHNSTAPTDGGGNSDCFD